jgi:hypothetical protein
MIGRRALATAAALAGLVIGAPTTLADASFDPSVDGPVATTGNVDVLPVVLVIAVGLAFVLLLKTRGPTAALTVIVALLGLVNGALFIAAGLFGDFSGQHRIFPIPILAGIAILVATAIWLWRRRRSRPSASPASAVDEPREA